MKTILITILILTTKIGYSQKTPDFSQLVNTNSSTANLTLAAIKNNQRKDVINLQYSNFGMTFLELIKSNIRNGMERNLTTNYKIGSYTTSSIEQFIIRRAVRNYLVGGTEEQKILVAARIVHDITDGRLQLAGNDSFNFLNNFPFADDLRLFKDVAQGQANISILKSPDTQIPINVISHFPLLLVNNKNESRFISLKSISIK